MSPASASATSAASLVTLFVVPATERKFSCLGRVSCLRGEGGGQPAARAPARAAPRGPAPRVPLCVVPAAERKFSCLGRFSCLRGEGADQTAAGTASGSVS